MNSVALRAAVAGRAESSRLAVGDQLQDTTMFDRHARSVTVDVCGSILRAHIPQREAFHATHLLLIRFWSGPAESHHRVDLPSRVFLAAAGQMQVAGRRLE